MLGSTNAACVKEVVEAVEYVNITLDTNQADSTDLMGIDVVVSYAGIRHVLAWNGGQSSYSIPAGTEYTVSFSDVDGYKTPDSVTFTAESGNSRSVYAQYRTEIVSITLLASDGTQISGQTVTVNGVTHTYTGVPIVVKMPYGITYTITSSGKQGFFAPSPQSFTASQGERLVSLVYEEMNLPHTTIRIDQTITDPATMITRIVDKGGVEAIRANSHRYLGKYTAEGTMTVCQLDDTDSNKYANGSPSDLTGAEGDVFMRMPQFYYKATEYATDIWDITFVYGGKPDDSYQEWSANALIGVYESYSDKVMAYSISDQYSSYQIKQADFKAYARNRGTGFQLVDWQMHCVMALLYYAQYGHINCQQKIGAGTGTSGKSSGQTNVCGMNDTRGSSPVSGLNDTGANGNTQSINFWGLENWWGNKEEFIDNVSTSKKVFTVTEPDGTIRTMYSSTHLIEGYITQMLFGDKCDLMPIACYSSTTSGFCDIFINNSSTDSRPLRRSGKSYSENGGIVYLSTESESATQTDVTSRLAFRGQVVEETNVQTFKGLPGGMAKVTWESQSGIWNPSTSSDAAGGVSYTCESPGTNGSTIIRCTFSGITSITFTCMYEGENDYDYLTIGELDTPCTRDSYGTSLKGESGIASDITFTCDSGEHYVEFCYSKDSSQDTQPDNATVYIKSYS